MTVGGKSWTRKGAFVLMIAVAVLAARAEGAGDGRGKLSLEIGRAEDLARKASDEVLAKEASAAAALRAVDAARASFFPKLSGSVSAAYLPQPPAGVTVTAGSLGTLPLWVPATTNPGSYYDGSNGFVYHPVELPSKDWTVGGYTNTYFKGNLTFTQPLFVWGKIKAALDLASLEAKVADIGSRGAALDAVRSANRSYYSAVLSREGAAILTELRGLAASILEDRKSALREGFATQEDVLSSTADLAALDTKLVQAREGEASALEALGLLTGLDPNAIVPVSPFRDVLPQFSEPSLKDEALASSTDVGIARARLSEARRKLDLERGSAMLLPNLSLFANLDVAGQDVPFSSSSWWKSNWSWDLSVGVAANVDFFDGGAAAARSGEASANLETARIGEGGAEKAASLEARRAIEAARGSEATVREKEARAAWAAEALRNERAKAAGETSSRAQVNAQAIAEASARLELLSARYQLEESIADLERIAGKEFR